MEEKELYDFAIKLWGKDAQLLMLIEEMNELNVEICHLLRKRYTNFGEMQGKLSEEIADVQIMLEQIILMHKLGSMVKKSRKEKLERLEKRLKEMSDLEDEF